MQNLCSIFFLFWKMILTFEHTFDIIKQNKCSKHTFAIFKEDSFMDDKKNQKLFSFHTILEKRSLILIFLSLLTILLILLFLLFPIKTAYADQNMEQNLTYRSIEIKAGDSLWSIASRYNNNTDLSVKEYIDKIVSCNSLSNTNIKAGCYLIIPYYE